MRTPNPISVALIVAAILCAAPFVHATPQVAFIQTQAPQQVLAPTTKSINTYQGMASLSDEHQTIFPPGTFASHPDDYVFFVATKSTLNGNTTPTTGDTSGLIVLASSGPAGPSNTWTLDFASDYGDYSGTFGQVFLSPMDRLSCPDVTMVASQDVTFDLNYANAAAVVFDPTNPGNAGPGNFLMVYEGTNKCVGVVNSSTATTNFYTAIGIATSNTYGVTWPTYKGSASYTFVDLPQQSLTQGPGVPWTSFASGGPVCLANDCASALPSPLYGRYGVLGPVVSIPTAAQGGPLTMSMGDGEPSAFVDDIGTSKAGGTYLYIMHGYVSGEAGLGSPGPTDPQSHGEIMVARAQLGTGEKLVFTKWFGNSVTYGDTSSGSFAPTTYALDASLSNNGTGVESPIFPTQASATAMSASYLSCQARGLQSQVMSSLSYVEETNQYLLIFVCNTPTDPANPTINDQLGVALFYSTLDASQYSLADQDRWATPQEVDASWEAYASISCPLHTLNYPTLMALGQASGHVSIADTFLFSMQGCAGAGDTTLRHYMSRSIVIVTSTDLVFRDGFDR
jgi:hypothetical protein